MGEALVIKAIGGGGGSGSGGAPTQGQFIANVDYLCTKTGNYQIICVGGGGGGSLMNVTWEKNDNRYTEVDGYGAGSGYFNWKIVHMNEGDTYKMTIGAGGIGAQSMNKTGNAGGTTSFGSLLSAAGGQGGIVGTVSSTTKQDDYGGAGGGYGAISCYYYTTGSGGSKYGYGYGGELLTTNDSITGAFRVIGNHAASSPTGISGIGANGVNASSSSRLVYGDGGDSGKYDYDNRVVERYGNNGVHGCIFVNYIN